MSMDTLQADTQRLTPDQYRARAQLVRRTADEMTRETLRRQLLRIADEYDLLAGSVERTPFR